MSELPVEVGSRVRLPSGEVFQLLDAHGVGEVNAKLWSSVDGKSFCTSDYLLKTGFVVVSKGWEHERRAEELTREAQRLGMGYNDDDLPLSVADEAAKYNAAVRAEEIIELAQQIYIHNITEGTIKDCFEAAEEWLEYKDKWLKERKANASN